MRVLLGTVLALAFTFAGCAETTFDPIPSAGWKAGNSFAYLGSVEGSFSSHEEVDGEVMEDVQDTNTVDPIPVLSYRVINTHAADGAEPLYLVVAASGPEALELDSGATIGDVGVSGRTGFSVPDKVDGTSLFGVRQDNLAWLEAHLRGTALEVLASDSEFDTIRFPLIAGDSWTTNLGEDDGLTIVVQSKVGGMTSVPGPYGQVKAVHIHHNIEIQGLQEQMDEARKDAVAQGVDIQRFDVSMSFELDIFWAPSLHASVLETMYLSSSVDIAVDAEGQHVESQTSVQMRVNVALAQVDLAEAPETPIDQALVAKVTAPALATTDVLTQGPVGDDTSPGVLTATSSAALVNAAENAAVTFTADASGALGPVKWTLYDGAGVIVQQGDGTQFTTSFDRPGLYQVSFTAYDYSTKATLTANVALQADYNVVGEAVTCPPASAANNQCASRAVPLGAGMTTLKLTVARTPILVESGFGELVVKQGATELARIDMADNTASYLVSPDAVAGGDLTMSYVTPAGVGDSITYSIEGVFDSPSAPLGAKGRAFAQEQVDFMLGLL